VTPDSGSAERQHDACQAEAEQPTVVTQEDGVAIDDDNCQHQASKDQHANGVKKLSHGETPTATYGTTLTKNALPYGKLYYISIYC